MMKSSSPKPRAPGSDSERQPGPSLETLQQAAVDEMASFHSQLEENQGNVPHEDSTGSPGSHPDGGAGMRLRKAKAGASAPVDPADGKLPKRARTQASQARDSGEKLQTDVDGQNARVKQSKEAQRPVSDAKESHSGQDSKDFRNGKVGQACTRDYNGERNGIPPSHQGQLAQGTLACSYIKGSGAAPGIMTAEPVSRESDAAAKEEKPFNSRHDRKAADLPPKNCIREHTWRPLAVPIHDAHFQHYGYGLRDRPQYHG